MDIGGGSLLEEYEAGGGKPESKPIDVSGMGLDELQELWKTNPLLSTFIDK